MTLDIWESQWELLGGERGNIERYWGEMEKQHGETSRRQGVGWHITLSLAITTIYYLFNVLVLEQIQKTKYIIGK